MIGYVVLVSKDNGFYVIDRPNNALSDIITEKTRILRHPMSASVHAIEYDLNHKSEGCQTAVYQFTGKGEGGKAILWKISDHDATVVSHVVVGLKDGKRVYHTGDVKNKVSTRLVDAERFHQFLDTAQVETYLRHESDNPDSPWYGVKDIHTENIVEDITSVDIRQECIRFPCALPD